MQRGFINPEEIIFEERFQEKGYIVLDIEDKAPLEQIRSTVIEVASEHLGVFGGDATEFLNGVHRLVAPDKLNELRIHVINKINAQTWVREALFRLGRHMLEILVGNELAMQLRVNLSIQMPRDDSSLLPIHADVWSGDSPFEVVLWLPLVDCYGSKSMYILPPAPAQRLYECFSELQGKSSEELFQAIESDVDWIEIRYGEVMIFNQNLPHGNQVNTESETRWSMNCRFKGVFTPYGDKKLGEFFEPITLRVASRNGMNYKHPVVS